MTRIITQIYEIQSPQEAEKLIEMGVDHIGSVLVSESSRKVPLIRETMALVAATTVCRSSLIPLFSNPESILDALDYYRPHIVHFCESLPLGQGKVSAAGLANFIQVQQTVREMFPGIKIMRSIPLPVRGQKPPALLMELVRAFEPVSDYFLTDTLLDAAAGCPADRQPVAGFVGITGKTCDWSLARSLVVSTRIPVILAGGISPENVFDAILGVRPAGVDSCTRTNATDASGRPVRFRKDLKKVARFVKETRRAESAMTECGEINSCAAVSSRQPI